MSLPDNWVDQLFSKLTITYGQAFMRQYAGLEPAEVKANWARVLAPFSQSKGALRYGLERIPADKPPNALQFRDLCRRPTEHDTATLKLPAPPANPALAAKVRDAFKRPSDAADPKAWARRLRDREVAGERLTKFQRDAWREAVGVFDTEPV